MSLQVQFDAFLNAMYTDSHLKNRTILWTFVALVLPAACFVAAGVPGKPAYITMAALIPPLQIVLYLSTSNREKRDTRSEIIDAKKKQSPTREGRPEESIAALAQRIGEQASLPDRPSAIERFRLPGLGSPEEVHGIESDIIVTHPNIDVADVRELLKNLKVQGGSLIFASHHGSFAAWPQPLGSLKVQSPTYITFASHAHADLKPETVLGPALLSGDRIMESVLSEQPEKESLKRVEEQAAQGSMSATLSATSVPAI